jgi:hypothetical protein
MDYELQSLAHEYDDTFEPLEAKLKKFFKHVVVELQNLEGRLETLEQSVGGGPLINTLQRDLSAIQHTIADIQSNTYANTARLDGCDWCGQGNLGTNEARNDGNAIIPITTDLGTSISGAGIIYDGM